MNLSFKLTLLGTVLAVAACSDSDEGVSGNGDGDGSGDTALDTAGGDAATDTAAGGDTAPTDDTTPSGDTSVPSTDTGNGQICQPGTSTCATFVSYQVCNAAGDGFEPSVMCGEDERCGNGECFVACPNDPKFGVFAGCEYWATDLPNYPDPATNPTPEDLPWALVVSNPRDEPVTVGFEMPPAYTYSPADPVVPANSSRVFEMPSINVQGTDIGHYGVHLTATGPVIVHQFNPWDNQFSNDASLLMPDPLLGDRYYILSWPSSNFEAGGEIIPGFNPPNQNGYFTVIASADNTDVTFRLTAPVRANGLIPALPRNALHTVTLDRGEVLSIQTDGESLFDLVDLTGSFIGASKPVAVFGGHEEAVVGDPVTDPQTGETSGPCCADHLEEQMVAIELLTGNVFAGKSPSRGTEDDVWRIVAADNNVSITTDPPIPGLDGQTLATAGQWLEAKTDKSFEINATGRILVGQYLVSGQATDTVTGDPSLTIAMPAERFRKDYAFAVPDKGYSRLDVSIIKPVGVSVTIDDVAVPEANFTAIGQSGWQQGYASITPGVHVASGSEAFGLYVYGYSNAVSFGYAAGLALPGE